MVFSNITMKTKETRTMGYGPRRHTRRNPNHPTNIMREVGQTAKADVRKLSNDDLNKWLRENMGEMKDLESVLQWPRHRKVKLVKDCAMVGFANEYEKAKAEAERKAKAEKEKKEQFENE